MSSSPKAIAAGLLTCILGQAAFSGGATEQGAAPAPALTLQTTDWSGLYLGLSSTSARGDNSWRQASDGLELVPEPWEGSGLTVSLGHNWQSGQLTYGAQFAYGNGDYIARPGDAPFINCSNCATEATDLFTLIGTVGFATGQTHLFATGGIAKANVTATNTDGLQVYADTSMTGWTLGLGVEQRIGDQLSLALSYDRVDLGTLPLPAYLPTGETAVGFNRMQVGMNLRW